jgi:hypothetical protein
MKRILPTLTLVTSLSALAQTAPAEPDILGQPAASPDVANTVNQALQQAGQATQFALKTAANALNHAHGNLVLNEEDDAGDVSRMFLSDGPMALEHIFGAPGRTGGQPLIVRSGQPGATNVSNLQEDLVIMSRILTKAVGREGRDAAMGIVLSALPGSRHPQSIYLEGYGALFLLNVKFPLVPPSVKEDEKPEKPTDTTWDETKRELYGQRPGTVRIWNPAGADTTAEYNADQVEDLKKELLDALKNATHLRDLKPEEFVTVAVTGGREGAVTTHVKRTKKTVGGNVTTADTYASAENKPTASHESTLVIRVKKADVDAFAKGDTDLEQFKKRASISAY